MNLRALLVSLALVAPGAARTDELPAGEPREWGERSGWNTELVAGQGLGVFGGRDADSVHRSGVVGDATIRLGIHHVGRFHDKSLIGVRASSVAWCMPLMMCGGAPGLLLGPTSGFLGNELGVDLAAHVFYGVSADAPRLGFALGVRPTFRVARDSRFRTASYVGSLLPEVGLAFPSGRARELYVELSLYPIAATITRQLGVQWDVLRERIGIPLDGARVNITASTSISLMWL